jgi:hypothetical protein
MSDPSATTKTRSRKPRTYHAHIDEPTLFRGVVDVVNGTGLIELRLNLQSSWTTGGRDEAREENGYVYDLIPTATARRYALDILALCDRVEKSKAEAEAKAE